MIASRKCFMHEILVIVIFLVTNTLSVIYVVDTFYLNILKLTCFVLVLPVYKIFINVHPCS
jgi:hypothetical protein